jgi:hypothetical protein
MDEREYVRRQNMLAEIGRFYRELRLYTLRYGRNHLDSAQSEFYRKLCSLRVLRNGTGYRDALSKIDTEGLARYRDMVRDLLSLLIGNRINNISPLDTIMWENEEERDVIYDERILAISTLERDGNADFNILNNRWTYADERLPDNIRLPIYGPCYMRTLMAVAETFVGRNLSLDELGRLLPILTTGEGAPAPKNDEYYVNSGESVVMETLGILEPGRNYRVIVSRPNDSDYANVRENAVGSLLGVPGHWQEGDKHGRFRWDGYWGVDNSKHKDSIISEIRYVSIERLSSIDQR